MSKYSEDISAIRRVVDTLPSRLDCIENHLITLNGTVGDHGEALAGLVQWKENHRETHADLRERLSTLNKRLWGFSGLNGLLTAFMAWLSR